MSLTLALGCFQIGQDGSTMFRDFTDRASWLLVWRFSENKVERVTMLRYQRGGINPSCCNMSAS